jgi:predicted transcriptional regulator of viral defense system
MNYIQFRELFKDFTVFSLRDIENTGRRFHRRRLVEWQAKGYIRKVVKAYYVFADLDLREEVLFEIANRIYSPSYVSLEMALAYYQLIPESVYGVTSVSSRRTYRFRTPLAVFSYRTVRPRLLFGYEIISRGDKSFKIAAPEKAVLDYLYLNPGCRDEPGFSGLRLNPEVFSRLVQEKKYFSFIERFGKGALEKRARGLWEYIGRADS